MVKNSTKIEISKFDKVYSSLSPNDLEDGGIYNYGFRDYSPEMKRFTTVDPIRSSSTWYTYVNNDPVNKIDLWGLQESDNLETWVATGQEIVTGGAMVFLESGMAVQHGEGIYTFTSQTAGNSFEAKYSITQTNKAGIYMQLGTTVSNITNNPIFSTTADLPSGKTNQEVAESFEGKFSSASLGIGVVGVTYFEGGEWTGSSIDTFAGGSAPVGIAFGEFDYTLLGIYE